MADPARAGQWSEHIFCGDDMRCSRCGAVEPYPDPGPPPEPEGVTEDTPVAVAHELRRKAKAKHELEALMEAIWNFTERHRDCQAAPGAFSTSVT